MPDYKHDLPSNYYFGGGDDATSATPLAVVVLVSALILILVLPRKYAFVPFLIAGLLVPLHVVVLVGALHFNATRILIVVGWVRVLLRGDRLKGYLRTLDALALISALWGAVMYSVLWGDFGAVVNRMGVLMTTMGGYFLLRRLIRDKTDVLLAIKAMGCAAVVIAPCMAYEHLTSYNPFWLLGAPEMTNVRDGQIRAQGPFGHAITAGVVGAVLFPLFVGWFLERRRWLALAAAASATTIMVFSRSSTPVLTYGAALLGLAMWPVRKSMRIVRWVFVLALLVAQLGMGAPIWFVMERASGVMGGSGWHRAMLIDTFVRHFWDWWLYGTRSNPDWGWSMWDVDNAYVGAGLSGGLVNFVLFIAVLVCAFRVVGKGRRLAEKSESGLRIIWVLGTALFANTVAYFGIVYFDQAVVAWYALLAMIAVIPEFSAARRTALQAVEKVRDEAGFSLATGYESSHA